jgi:transcriptional regulator with PAS, ATPase and Fis domain
MKITTELQAIMNSFREPAILLSLDYEILLANSAYRTAYGFTEQPTRHRCYQVSHGYSVPCDLAGETCPLKQSLESGENSRVLHIHHTPRGKEYVNVEMSPVKDPQSNETIFFIERMCPSDAATTSTSQERLVGSSPSFQRMLNFVERVAPSDTNVMLLGESGTGKELVAETIHRLSDRNGQPFVPVECTGLPEALFESELFGYVKGAFTGAESNRPGLIETASGGTLFLDEVGDIPLSDQVKLLRLLETRRYRRVGSTEWQEADFRLICATNKDLSAMIDSGRFREDLYYRLGVFEIQLPPLRERMEDLEILIATILDRLSTPDIKFSDKSLDYLRRYRFPGNIRELRNIVERAVLLTDDGIVHRSNLPSKIFIEAEDNQATQPQPDKIIPLKEAERQYLRHALSIHRGERKNLAAKLDVSERALYRKLASLRSGD